MHMAISQNLTVLPSTSFCNQLRTTQPRQILQWFYDWSLVNFQSKKADVMQAIFLQPAEAVANLQCVCVMKLHNISCKYSS